MQQEYDPIHDTLNPYTAVQRSKSQWLVWDPLAEPLKDLKPKEAQNNITILTVSHDAMNLNSIPLSASKTSMISFSNVVPEVVAAPSGSEVDTRSAGNPYSHHPNFTTPSQYFGHLEEIQNKEETEGNTLTVMDIQGMKDPFGVTYGVGFGPEVTINPPNDVTINKNAFTSESLADLDALSVEFPSKSFSPTPFQSNPAPIAQTQTLNKKMLSPESMYELGEIDVDFEGKENINMAVLRDFSLDSIADIRELRNLSEYSDFDLGAPNDVIIRQKSNSPTKSAIEQFERSENVQYGMV